MPEDNPSPEVEGVELTLNLDAIAEESPPNIPGGDSDERLYINSLDGQHRKEDLYGKIQDRIERKKYADKIFRLIRAWLISVCVILLLVGFGGDQSNSFMVSVGTHTFIFKFHTGFTLGDDVIITLLGSTTASVFGIFVVVANYLFPRKPTS